MFNDIYNKKILHFAGNIDHLGGLPPPYFSFEKTSLLCGSRIKVYLHLQSNSIVRFGQEISACVLGQASAAILAQNIEGLQIEDFVKLRQCMYKMLKDNGPPPGGKFKDFSCLQPASPFTARHDSILLVFDAVYACLEENAYLHR